MLLYAAKIMRDPRMGNPTLVFITDRNDLDDQLFGEVFAPAEILPEKPGQADSRSRTAAAAATRVSGGIVFTTIQKFAPEERGDVHPVLTDRRNVVVIADEAHRSPVRLRDLMPTAATGLAKHMRDALPNATYLGFTGTPIESTDKSTRAVFGDYIDVYDLTRAVEDGATVRIFYESRLAKVSLPEEAPTSARRRRRRDHREAEEDDATRKAKSPLGAARGDRRRQSSGSTSSRPTSSTTGRSAGEELFGKAMIVAMSRRIAVELYERIVALRPDWHDDDPTQGRIKVVMTGSAADPPAFQPHLYPQGRPQGAQGCARRTRTIRWRSSSSATCGSPASTRRRCTRCTSTSRCRAPG